MASVPSNTPSEICRLCMEKGRLLPIFGVPLRAGAATRIVNDHSDSIMKYADVRVRKDDSLPQKMCYGCLFLLKSAIQFKTTCERSDRMLNRMLRDGDQNAEGKIKGWSDLGRIFTLKQETNEQNTEEGEISTYSFYKETDCISSGTLEATQKIEIVDCTAEFLENEDDSYILISGDLDDNEHISSDEDRSQCIRNPNETNSEDHGTVLRDKDNAVSDPVVVGNSNSTVTKPVSKIKLKKRKYSPADRIYLQILQRSKIKRKRRNKRDNEAEFKSLAEKITGLESCQTDDDKTLVLQRLVLSNGRKQRSETIDHQFREQSRLLFRSVDGPKKLVQCTVCDAVVKTGSAHNHSQKHLGYKIICELCGKGFASHFGLEQHLMTRHGKEKNLACQYCSYRTGNRFELRVHERSHTGERPFVCDLCGRSFFRRFCMVKHIMLHSQIKRHTCRVCPKGYVHLSDLKAHVNAVHDRRYVYKCELCDLSYAKGSTVRKHLAIQHSIPRDQQGSIPRVYLC